jgi:predicted amidophosphoribosyltransferase
MFKHCPECGQEFQHWVTRCTDCDVALVLAAEPLAPAREPAPPPPEDQVLLKLDEPWALQQLAEVLQQQGISSWIDAHTPAAQQPREPRLGLSVRRRDLDAARAIAEEHVASGLPDLEGVDVPRYDASACPACGEPTPEHAAACSACGLEFPEVDPDSGQIVR